MVTSRRSASRERRSAAWCSASACSARAASRARLTSLARRPIDRALLLAQLAELVKDLHQRRRASQVGDAPGFQRGLVAGLSQRLAGILFDLIELCEHS